MTGFVQIYLKKSNNDICSLLRAYSKFNIPTFITIHGTDLKQLKTAPHLKEFVEKGLPSVSHFFSINNYFSDLAQKNYTIKNSQITNVGNGFNKKKIHIKEEPISKKNGPIILYAGKFVEWKGIKYLIKACGKISKKFQLVIVGGGTLKSEIELKRIAEKENLDSKIEFTGHLQQEKLFSLMSKTKVFVLPSIIEPFGLVLLEAMACGCFVVAADIGGPADFVPKEMIKKGYATLVPPLLEQETKGEEEYIYAIKEAIEKKLKLEQTINTKISIHDSVKHLSWRNYYLKVRRIYEQFVG